MTLSNYWLPTLKDAPADAEAISHRLMVRAGLIRQLGAGIWTWMPAGLRSVTRVEAVIREEMDAIGCHEMLMPVLQPAEPWRATGRYEIDELFKLEDRKGSDLVLAMTHEEALTYHVARDIRSYRDLPLMLYQLQTKERDEPRPARRASCARREFTMKDAYSFDRDEEGLARSYELQAGAYERIMDRCGLRWYAVESDVGHDGRLGRARVHGALRRGRERGRAGARLRRERRGRERRPPAGRAAAAARRSRARRRRRG